MNQQENTLDLNPWNHHGLPQGPSRFIMSADYWNCVTGVIQPNERQICNYQLKELTHENILKKQASWLACREALAIQVLPFYVIELEVQPKKAELQKEGPSGKTTGWAVVFKVGGNGSVFEEGDSTWVQGYPDSTKAIDLGKWLAAQTNLPFEAAPFHPQ